MSESISKYEKVFIPGTSNIQHYVSETIKLQLLNYCVLRVKSHCEEQIMLTVKRNYEFLG
jgi:hypothetical protein